jgi:hypothetical protein
MVIGELGDQAERLVEAFLADPALRASVAMCDLGRLERVGAVRSSAFVYQWFCARLGVGCCPQRRSMGLIDGILSLGVVKKCACQCDVSH